MNKENTVTVMVILIALISAVAAGFGIFYDSGSGVYEYESIRGQIVEIYGKGLYRHMSADVAIQGIAQDYVTLFIGIPVLLLGLYHAKGSVRGKFVLSGALGYFWVTYLLYTAMSMYNILTFLILPFSP